MKLKYRYKVGDLVKITNTLKFNTAFVKQNDIAKIIRFDGKLLYTK